MWDRKWCCIRWNYELAIPPEWPLRCLITLDKEKRWPMTLPQRVVFDVLPTIVIKITVDFSQCRTVQQSGWDQESTWVMVAFFLGCKGVRDGWRGEGRGKIRSVLIPSLIPLLEAMGYRLYRSLLSLLNQTLTVVSEKTDMSGLVASKACGFYQKSE